MIKISDKIHAIIEEYCMTKRLYEFNPNHEIFLNLCPLDGAITVLQAEECSIGTKPFFTIESEKLCEICYERATTPGFTPIFHFINQVLGWHLLKYHDYLPEQLKEKNLILT